MELRTDAETIGEERDMESRALGNIGVVISDGRRENTVLRYPSYQDGADTALPSTSRSVTAALVNLDEWEHYGESLGVSTVVSPTVSPGVSDPVTSQQHRGTPEVSTMVSPTVSPGVSDPVTSQQHRGTPEVSTMVSPTVSPGVSETVSPLQSQETPEVSLRVSPGVSETVSPLQSQETPEVSPRVSLGVSETVSPCNPKKHRGYRPGYRRVMSELEELRQRLAEAELANLAYAEKEEELQQKLRDARLRLTYGSAGAEGKDSGEGKWDVRNPMSELVELLRSSGVGARPEVHKAGGYSEEESEGEKQGPASEDNEGVEYRGRSESAEEEVESNGVLRPSTPLGRESEGEEQNETGLESSEEGDSGSSWESFSHQSDNGSVHSFPSGTGSVMGPVDLVVPHWMRGQATTSHLAVAGSSHTPWSDPSTASSSPLLSISDAGSPTPGQGTASTPGSIEAPYWESDPRSLGPHPEDSTPPSPVPAEVHPEVDVDRRPQRTRCRPRRFLDYETKGPRYTMYEVATTPVLDLASGRHLRVSTQFRYFIVSQDREYYAGLEVFDKETCRQRPMLICSPSFPLVHRSVKDCISSIYYQNSGAATTCEWSVLVQPQQLSGDGKLPARSGIIVCHSPLYSQSSVRMRLQ
ncbi:hypothetical protein GE061_000520 [Apolygus lucorum]|uniref:Uncharacterized protein n=1 Tax=Apolygus lucorum TaxID=248454 RepID=A0A8S9Y4J5_APOLU|nr:hypothetical protein GE061_000520 [Apolygus lucorum]